MVLLFGLATKDEDVVHVYDYDSLIYKFLEDVIHHFLECCQAISETKEHDSRFEQASVHPKGCFPFVSLLDPYIVISLLNVQVGEILHLGFGYHI